jgi:CRISPR-associated protein Cas5h
MSAVVIFDVRGSMAHFRRPDTLATHATYPFITRTALRGLAAAILGQGELPGEVRAGVRLMRPVRTVVQELSLHGKTWTAGSGQPASFHRPTALEFVVEPHYRIYYRGSQAEELAERLQRRQSGYHTYLGSAYCLTFPVWVGLAEAAPRSVEVGSVLECVSVVPSNAVRRVLPEPGRALARVGGLLWEHEGAFAARRFRGTVVSALYDPSGGPVRFEAAERQPGCFWEFHDLPGEGVVCLW